MLYRILFTIYEKISSYSYMLIFYKSSGIQIKYPTCSNIFSQTCTVR